MYLKISQNLQQRLWMSLIGIIVLFIALYYSYHPLLKPLFIALCTLLICSSLWEFYRIAKAKGYQPLSKIGILATACYVFAVSVEVFVPGLKMLPVAVLGVTLLAAFLYYFIKGADPFVNLALTLFGLFYLTLPLTCVLYINYLFPEGRWWVIYTIAVTKITDIGAYVCGKLFGNHRMTPYISPKKTWEGALGGFLAALLTSVLMNQLTPLNMDLSISLVIGAFVSGLAQFGDLAESLLKRDVGVKDSNQLPGLGGVLDILDSLVFTIPFIYLFLQFSRGN